MPNDILVVDDDPAFRATAAKVLASEGFRPLEASGGAEALALARKRRPDLVVLDLRMPDVDGLEVCRKLKEGGETAAIPVLVLTAYDQEGQDVTCLDLGADSYLTKPVTMDRLLAHCRALLRRSEGGARKAARAGAMELDHARKVVRFGEKEISNLTPKEFEILYVLCCKSPDPVDRETLYRAVWGAEPPSTASLKTVEVHVHRIRLKLGLKADQWLLQVSGRGYCLKPSP